MVLHAQPVVLRVIATTDIHGNYLACDYLANQDGSGGLARVATYVAQQRAQRGSDNILLLDAGDILQGQPAAYYYNYVDTDTEHLCASVLNAMRYDAGVPGNHDIEAGHTVYDRWTRQCLHPIVCANVTDTRLGNPYWQPYTIIQRDKVRIAVIGLLTPAVPKWLPESLWSGLAFGDMLNAARRYVQEIEEKRLADVIIGVFHSGVGRANEEGVSAENATLQVARHVPGFDLIICGHDHRQFNERVRCYNGREVLVLNPGARGAAVAVADLTIERKGKRYRVTHTKGELADIRSLEPNAQFQRLFADQHDALLRFTQKPLALLDTTFSSQDAFFGSSAMVDLTHNLQLRLSGADISFAAPLTFNATFHTDTLRVRDLFSLYPYENLLCTMVLSGREVRGYLEKSYDGWVRSMTSPTDTMLRFRPDPLQYTEGWQRLETSSYNFDSAAGLCYTVDLRGRRGTRVHIDSLSDGRRFCDDSLYVVAVNSYRASGGGELLTEGAGIPKDSLQSRIIGSTTHDLRHYLMQVITTSETAADTLHENGQTMLPAFHPAPHVNWRFIPSDWAAQARRREQQWLFGE